MVLCKFYQEGRCNRGASCSFEHVTPNQAWRGNQTNAQTTTDKYNEASIQLALKDERPPWHLSVFGPAKEEPNLIVGTDRSPEEDRMLYYLSMRQTGNINQYIQSHENALQELNKQVTAIQGNTRGAIQHYEKEKSASTSAFGASDPNKQFSPFLGNNAGAGFGGGGGGGAFGGGAFGMKPSVFGGGNISKPGFGQPAFGSTSGLGGGAGGGPSAFGQPSTLGGGSAFGKPSAFGQPSALGGSAFGQPSALGGGSAFGQPSALGGGSAFGQTSALGGAAAFGQPSALGGGSAFGQPSALGGGGSSAFGQPSALGDGSAFGQPSALGGGGSSAFGKPSALGGGPAFGSTSALGNSAPAFGATSSVGAFGTNNPANVFGQPQQQQPNGAAIDVSDPKFAPFKQDHFEYKLIPEIEPPMGLR